MKLNINKYKFFQVFVVFCFLGCDKNIFTPVVNVCNGEIVESANKYDPQGKIHKIILYEKNKRSDWYSDLPEECQGTYTDFELVGCIDKTDSELEKCSYTNGGTRTRKAKKVTITIFEAKTGNQIASNSFYGTVDICPQTITSKTDEDITGNDVSYDDVKAWLLGYLQK